MTNPRTRSKPARQRKKRRAKKGDNGSSKKAVEYLVKPGARISKKCATDVGKTIDMLIEQGRGTPEELVQEASSPKCPAHEHFPWNDREAAHQHRLALARKYFRSIAIVIKGVSNSKPIRRYWHIKKTSPDGDNGGSGYHHADRVRKEPDMQERLARRARQELRDWMRRYDTVREIGGLKPIFEFLERFIDEIERKT
jgi:hypothetical protein